MSPIHAGLIAWRQRQGWSGALVRGPSGVGKSDLMLRALDRGFRLVADDRTLVWPAQGRLFGRPPDSLAGLMEIRGMGIVARSFVPFCSIDLVVECVATADEVVRMPETASLDLMGVQIPHWRVWPREPSAIMKLVAMMCRTGRERQQAYQ